jgi:hypothetical protein
MVDNHWLAIEAVTHDLLRRDPLDRDELRDVILGAMKASVYG